MIWLLALLNHRNMCQERMQLARRKVTEKLCELTEPGDQIFKNHEPFRHFLGDFGDFPCRCLEERRKESIERGAHGS